MKKENKKLAQERKAQEKKKKQQKKLLKNLLIIAALLLIIGVFVWLLSLPSNEETNDANTAYDTTTDITASASDSSSFNSDTSLVVEDGDTVNIDYVGTVGGVEFSGGNTQGMGTDLTIGSGMYIDDFEQQLIGSHPGDTVEVVVTFPENYGVEELNGQEAVFTTIINGIYK